MLNSRQIYLRNVYNIDIKIMQWMQTSHVAIDAAKNG